MGSVHKAPSEVSSTSLSPDVIQRSAQFDLRHGRSKGDTRASARLRDRVDGRIKSGHDEAAVDGGIKSGHDKALAMELGTVGVRVVYWRA